MRKAAPADLPVLAEIENLCNPSPWSVAQLQAALFAPSHIWLAETADAHGRPAVCALLVWQEIMDEAEIHLLDTHPDYRRRGLAGSLLDALIAHARERQWWRVILEVRASNHAAQTLYRSRGFTECGRRRAYYGGLEDAVLMEKLC